MVKSIKSCSGSTPASVRWSCEAGTAQATNCPRPQEEHRPVALGKEDLKRENSAAKHGSITRNEASGWSRVYPAAFGFCVWLNADFNMGCVQSHET